MEIKYYLPVLLIAAIGIITGGILISTSEDNKEQELPSELDREQENSSNQSVDEEENDTQIPELAMIEIEKHRGQFEPNSHEVKLNERVEIVFINNDDEPCTLYIPKIDEGTQEVSFGESDEIYFTFEQDGNYEFYCREEELSDITGEIIVS